jgi:hypothetical protein
VPRPAENVIDPSGMSDFIFYPTFLGHGHCLSTTHEVSSVANGNDPSGFYFRLGLFYILR